MSILKKIKDKTGTIHDLGDSRVDAFETELSGAEHNVPYSPAVLAKTNAIEASVSSHIGNTANPHEVTKAQIGLANVENKSSTQIRSELTKENVTNALGYTPIDESRIGAANGVASLDASGRIPASQIPGGFDNIEEYDNLAAFPTTGEEGKIYVAKDTNLTYRWTGSQYVEISPSLALGETATTAYRGDRGKVAYDHSQVSGNSTIHHTHDNKELLDSYTQTEADLANAVSKVHEHSNKAVLDGITATDISNWNNKQNRLTAGDNITINGSTISSDQVFVATYGTTTYQEIKDAHEAGKICLIFSNDLYYYLNLIEKNRIRFISQTTNPAFGMLTVFSNDSWESSNSWLQSRLTFDAAPTAGSTNPVTSDGIKSALDLKSNDSDLTAHKNDTTVHITEAERTAWNAKQSALTFDTTPTAGSTNPVTSEGIKTALEVLQSNIDTVDAKGIVINEINGENVICFE